ncbi:hypothetical protein [Acetobacter sp.]|uniref:hypothetical protein n=1 Tax=Acetobacter sp. TaxID=440 RepID=UPI0039E86FA6
MSETLEPSASSTVPGWAAELQEGMDEQREELRSVSEKLSLLIEILSPKETEGPTLDDLLARLIEVVQEQNPILRRIDRTTGFTLDHLEGRPVRRDGDEDAHLS